MKTMMRKGFGMFVVGLLCLGMFTGCGKVKGRFLGKKYSQDCQTNLKELALAINMHALDDDDKYPKGYCYAGLDQVRPELVNVKAFVCPLSAGKTESSDTLNKETCSYVYLWGVQKGDAMEMREFKDPSKTPLLVCRNVHQGASSKEPALNVCFLDCHVESVAMEKDEQPKDTLKRLLEDAKLSPQNITRALTAFEDSL